jgi:hypothetical protein
LLNHGDRSTRKVRRWEGSSRKEKESFTLENNISRFKRGHIEKQGLKVRDTEDVK